MNEKFKNIFTTSSQFILSKRQFVPTWVVDSGCSRHMTGSIELLYSYNKEEGGSRKIKGYGMIMKGEVRMNQNGLKHNLTSMSQLYDNGMDVLFKIKFCIMYKADTKIEPIEEEICISSILIHWRPNKKVAFSPLSKNEEVWLWHTRFCHINFHTLDKLVRVLRKYLTSLGITHNFSAPRTPQQNGVVERNNRTLVEAATIMLNVSGLSLTFCAEAVSTTFYTQNRSLMRTLGYQWDCSAYRAFPVHNHSLQTITINSTNIYYSSNSFTSTRAESTKSEVVPPLNVTIHSQTQQVPTIEPSSLEEISSTIYLPHAINWTKDHPQSQIIGDPSEGVKTRATTNFCLFSCFVNEIEPKNVADALKPCKIRFFNLRQIMYEHLLFSQVVKCHWNKVVFQMDVKYAFLNGKVKEEVYVQQPPGFESEKYPNHVYFLDKALYGLKQALRARYERLSIFLIENDFHKGTTDVTLYYRKKDDGILLVQIYVDDIIFGSIDDSMCKEFERLMEIEFEMSMMGKLTFFLGLQQSKYINDLLTKYQLADASPMRTSMATGTRLHAHLNGHFVECKLYRGNVEMYFVTSEHQLADFFTKALDEKKFTYLVQKLACSL
ncbi:LOW QUALITY PROTEIN: hypothetical protein OSB04_024722 [Centaurea solstitialis]|uniref:Integrase catalytic domain-containing protein n=1 Tax=Centaurea solstitialis TaxID=347529 RepID=A0AA38WAM6_9ASTR|nr:LOW QUALITY PROTEIN: hypothetical protein OSB04_024722 [Centaurea solstitialis]